MTTFVVTKCDFNIQLFQNAFRLKRRKEMKIKQNHLWKK